MIYFTADLHFGHKNIIKYCKRPFSTIEEMDLALINNWNSVVDIKDIVYILGDVTFNIESLKFYMSQLKGSIKIIPGNHDNWLNAFDCHKVISISNFEVQLLPSLYELKRMVLCHYQMKNWNRAHYNSIHLYGHSHGNSISEGKSMDVGVDCNNFTPISIDKVLSIMETKPNNFNYIGE